MTALVAHVDPAFSGVFGIEAVNEPLLSVAMTPGYGDCEFQLSCFPSMIDRRIHVSDSHINRSNRFCADYYGG